MQKILLYLSLMLLSLLTSCANFQSFSLFPPNLQTQRTITKYHSSNSIQNTPTDNSKISLNDDTTSDNLWEKISEDLKIPTPENHPEVQAQIRWFMAHPSYLQRTTERARPYLYIVYQEVKNRNLPTELVLLPINESAYYPFSYSSRGASGIWQLMPGTASNFGLKRNFWYDGRRDIFDSTNAALDYLTYLAHYFNGDWLLAIAAYDTGEGNVENAIARNLREGKPTDFWSLRLASETRSYVPRLLALATIIAHPDQYPMLLPPVEAKPVVAPVHINQQLKLTDAAKLAGISINQLKVLNPGLSRTATDPSNDAKLLLPIDSIKSFKTNLNHYVAENFKPSTQINLDQTPLTLSNDDQLNTDATPIPSSYHPTLQKHVIKHKIVQGETLSSISKHYGTSVKQLQRLNPGVNRLHIGQVLIVQTTNNPLFPSTHHTHLTSKSSKSTHKKTVKKKMGAA